jgi:uncharacterized protein (TIGR03085 family)
MGDGRAGASAAFAAPSPRVHVAVDEAWDSHAVTTTYARSERALLLRLLRRLGPDAPTLSGWWTTHDLAAHLVVRDREPAALPGLVVPRLHGITEARERRARTRPYADLLEQLEAGPPAWSPTGLPGAGYEFGNLHEFFVHHEDARRPTEAQPRWLDAGLEDALWRRTRVLAPVFAARARGLHLRIEAPGGRSLAARRGPREAVVSGPVGEVFLWLWGRRDVAQVTVTGDGAALTARVHP